MLYFLEFRPLNGPEISTVLTKLAPSFCTIHVVAKGRLSHSRISTATPPPKQQGHPPQPGPSQMIFSKSNAIARNGKVGELFVCLNFSQLSF